MARTEVGTRVLAIRDSNVGDKKVFVYGYGIYEGDFPRPGHQNPPVSDLDLIRKVIIGSDREESLQQNRDWMRSFLAGLVSQEKMTQEQADEDFGKFLDKQAAERKRPLEERVLDHWNQMQLNPRIKLENDAGYAWGFHCWWGPADQADKKFEGWEYVTVPAEFGDGSQ